MNTPSNERIKFDPLPLGTRFRYVGGQDVWVKIENGGFGVIAKWDGPKSSRTFQSICAFAETESERATLEVELAEGDAHETFEQRPVAWRYKDTRGHWRYTGSEPKPEHEILKAEPLYAGPTPRKVGA